VRRVWLRIKGKPGEKCGTLEIIGGFVRRGVRAPCEEYADSEGNSRCGYRLHDEDTEALEGSSGKASYANEGYCWSDEVIVGICPNNCNTVAVKSSTRS
jgi:hypothetical protein